MSPDDYVQGVRGQRQGLGGKHNVPAVAFQDEGVPAEVLRKAGFTVQASTRKRRSGSSGKRVSRDDVKEVVRNIGVTFTIKDVVDISGASTATVRSTVKDLVDAKGVKGLGADPNHSGRGAAANLYSNN